MKRIWLSLVLVFAVVAAVAQTSYWRDEQGRPIAETESRRSSQGFAGWLLVTPDEDWQQKWDTPSSVVPHFHEADLVSRGEKLFILIFFANPALTSAGEANITCDLKVTRPDGSLSLEARDTLCYRGVPRGSPMHLYLSAPVIAFVGEPTDLAGVWRVEVTLKDNTRNLNLPLVTSFTLR